MLLALEPDLVKRAARRIACCLALTVAASCSVTTRLPLDVSAAVNRDAMRLLQTQNIDLYYPAHLRREASAFAERAEGCVARLRAATTGRGGLSAQRVELIFADLPLNNAFVQPPAFTGDFFSLLPTHWTFDLGTEFGIPQGSDYVACHELAHYVHAQQTLRSLGGINRALGYVLTPQLGLDSWFWEGLATFYETRLQPGTGRAAWPAWHGLFHAAVAGRRVSGGDLSSLNRRAHVGHHYLYGSEFIAYLVESYGENRLWQLIERQGKAFFFPFIVNQRFKRVYGKRLSKLLDDFATYVSGKYPARERPPGQRTIRVVGANGRFARAPDGREAVIGDAMDQPPTLTVYAADGEVSYRTRLTDVLPKRRLVTPSSGNVSGLSFTGDGQKLYFVITDRDLVFQQARLVELDLGRERWRVVREDLRGIGGAISPDGSRYLFVAVDARGHTLSTLELATGQVRGIYRAPFGVFLSKPTYSPDGSQIAASMFGGAHAISLFDAQSGARLRTLSLPGAPLSDPSFVDRERLLFLAPHDGRFQAFLYDLPSRRLTRVTDAPYLAMHPRATRGTIRFFNREGFGYTVDEVALPTPGASAISTMAFAPRTFADAQDAATPPAQPGADAGPAPAVGPVPEPRPGPALEEPGPLPAPGSAPASVVIPAPGPAPAPTPPLDPGAAPASSPAPQSPALPVVEGVIRALPPPPSVALAPARDRPYAVFPRLLIPSIRVPMFALNALTGGSAGFYLGGTDVLGKHRWGAFAALQPFAWLTSGGVSYLNTQLSPLLLGFGASQIAFDERTYDDDQVRHDRSRQRDLSLTALLTLRTSQLGLSLHGTDDRQWDTDEPLARHRALSGATLAFSHQALEATPMSGFRRGYFASLAGSYYPEQLGTLRSDVADVRGALNLYTPLPLSRRHTLSLGLRVRRLYHGELAQLLEVGGAQGDTVFSQPELEDHKDYVGLPPNRRFRESLRGFESAGFTTDRIGIVDLRYRYPVIVDRGTATSFSILPSFFFRQIDLELFASGAARSVHRLEQIGHLAAGGAISLRFAWWLVPFVLQYQLAKRFTDGRDLAHLLSLSSVL